MVSTVTAAGVYDAEGECFAAVAEIHVVTTIVYNPGVNVSLLRVPVRGIAVP